MKVPFSRFPGRHERHFRRKLSNPLFPHPIVEPDDSALLEVQRRDHDELVRFIDGLRTLVTRVVRLPARADSGLILELKEELDKAYEAAAGLGDDQSNNLQAIRELTAVIMGTVRRGAQGDGLAESELQAESVAREAHYSLLEYPVIADLLHPESLIFPDELAATLLSEPPDALAAALSLFDEVQVSEIVAQAQKRVSAAGVACPPEARERLQELESWQTV